MLQINTRDYARVATVQVGVSIAHTIPVPAGMDTEGLKEVIQDLPFPRGYVEDSCRIEDVKLKLPAEQPVNIVMYDFAFEIPEIEGHPPSPDQLREALTKRLDRLSDSELMEACGECDCYEDAAGSYHEEYLAPLTS